MNTNKVNFRLGVEVEREESYYVPFSFRVFHCRQKKNSPRMEEWAKDTVEFSSGMHAVMPSIASMKVGEIRRYWVHMKVLSRENAGGETETKITYIKVKPCK